MEKLRFTFLVFTVLLAFPVITVLELKRNQQNVNETTVVKVDITEPSYTVTGTIFRQSISKPGTANNSANKKGHIKYAL